MSEFNKILCEWPFYRQNAAKRQTAGIKFTQAKNEVFRPGGATRCTDLIQTWQGQRARGSAWLCKISPQSAQGWECGLKKFHFLVKSRLAKANPLTDF